MSFLSDIFAFEKSALKDNLSNLRKNPERILIGAGDPITSKVWGTALGKDYEPLVDQMGGAPQQAYDKAEAKGINTGPGKDMHMLARAIASYYAADYGMDKLGGGGGQDFGNIPTPGGQEQQQPDYRAQQKQALLDRAQQIRSRISMLRSQSNTETPVAEEPAKMADGGVVTKADRVLENLRSYGVL